MYFLLCDTFFSVSLMVREKFFTICFVFSFSGLNDIALVKMHQMINYTKFTQPACLPSIAGYPDLAAYVKHRMSNCHVIGWGARHADNSKNITTILVQEH